MMICRYVDMSILIKLLKDKIQCKTIPLTIRLSLIWKITISIGTSRNYNIPYMAIFTIYIYMIMIIHNHHVRLSLQLWPRQQWGWSLHWRAMRPRRKTWLRATWWAARWRWRSVRDVALVPTRTGLWKRGNSRNNWRFHEISMGNYFWFVPHLPVEGLQILSEWALADLNGERQMSDRMPQKKRNVEYTVQIGCQNMRVYIYIHISIYLYIR